MSGALAKRPTWWFFSINVQGATGISKTVMGLQSLAILVSSSVRVHPWELTQVGVFATRKEAVQVGLCVDPGGGAPVPRLPALHCEGGRPARGKVPTPGFSVLGCRGQHPACGSARPGLR